MQLGVFKCCMNMNVAIQNASSIGTGHLFGQFRGYTGQHVSEFPSQVLGVGGRLGEDGVGVGNSCLCKTVLLLSARTTAISF